MSVVMLQIFAERNQTCQRRNQRSHPADVYPEQKLGIIPRELRKEYRRRYVADKLAGKHGHKQGVFFQKGREQRSYSIHTRHIPRKDKEEHKRKQKGVIHLFKSLSIHKQQDSRNDNQPNKIMDHAKHDDDRKRKQRQIDCSFQRLRFDFFFADFQGFRLNEYKAASRHQSNRNGKRNCHNRHKFPRRDLELSIKIEILRVSKGSEHTAEIRSDILHNERKRHILFLSRRAKRNISKGKKGQKSHIVCDQHRPQKGDIDKRKNASASIFKELDDFLRKHIEKTDIFQGAHHCKGAKQAGERFKIEISEIFLIGRNENRGDERRRQRDKGHGVLFHERKDGVKQILQAMIAVYMNGNGHLFSPL